MGELGTGAQGFITVLKEEMTRGDRYQVLALCLAQSQPAARGGDLVIGRSVLWTVFVCSELELNVRSALVIGYLGLSLFSE